MKQLPPVVQRGFTLIEVMVVIVVISILASLVVLNVGGVDQRKAMQVRDIFLLDLKRILRESNDQSRILALSYDYATDVRPAQYQILEYTLNLASEQNQTEIKRWQAYEEFKSRTLPERVSFKMTRLDYATDAANNRDLLGDQSPELIWLGNGEVRPVRIQFYFEDRPLGAEIEIDHLGKINES